MWAERGFRPMGGIAARKVGPTVASPVCAGRTAHNPDEVSLVSACLLRFPLFDILAGFRGPSVVEKPLEVRDLRNLLAGGILRPISSLVRRELESKYTGSANSLSQTPATQRLAGPGAQRPRKLRKLDTCTWP